MPALGECTSYAFSLCIDRLLSRITIGYHRLYSHRAFRAAFAVRLVLAALGSMAFQGSIKVRASLASSNLII